MNKTDERGANPLSNLREITEIQKAHDAIDLLINHQLPPLTAGDGEEFIAISTAKEVLCWVLSHPDEAGERFAANLAGLYKSIRAEGWILEPESPPSLSDNN